MKVELKNIKIVQALSEETLCFTAVAYVDGIKTFYVSNRGHGGCDEYTEVDCKPETRARFDAVDAWAKTLPPDHYGDLELPSDLDRKRSQDMAQIQPEFAKLINYTYAT